MEPNVRAQGSSRRSDAWHRGRSMGRMLAIAILAGCQPPPPAPEPQPAAVVEPVVFAAWPRVTPEPAELSRRAALSCSVVPINSWTLKVEAERLGPHARYWTVVRVSPDGIAAYREQRPLPVGAVVVKEKYAGSGENLPMESYAVMTKREVGFAPSRGDWEYAFVDLGPERTVTTSQRQLAHCAECHASARKRDFLFRPY
jgi:hypothetical protein